MVGDAAERMDEETLRFLRQSLAMQASALEDPVRFLVLDREFHLAIYRRCANPVLAEFVGDLFGYMMQQRHRAVSERAPSRAAMPTTSTSCGRWREAIAMGRCAPSTCISSASTKRRCGSWDNSPPSATELRTGPTRAGDFNGRRIARQL